MQDVEALTLLEARTGCFRTFINILVGSLYKNINKKKMTTIYLIHITTA